MNSLFEKNILQGEPIQSIVVARFNDSKGAHKGRKAIEKLFEELEEEIQELFATQDGEAHAFEIAPIYARRGLRNDIGWEQSYPMLTSGENIAWALPPGADPEDARSILMDLGAVDIAIHMQNEEPEEWQTMPHPAIATIPEEDDEDDFEMRLPHEENVELFTFKKRTIH